MIHEISKIKSINWSDTPMNQEYLVEMQHAIESSYQSEPRNNPVEIIEYEDQQSIPPDTIDFPIISSAEIMTTEFIPPPNPSVLVTNKISEDPMILNLPATKLINVPKERYKIQVSKLKQNICKLRQNSLRQSQTVRAANRNRGDDDQIDEEFE